MICEAIAPQSCFLSKRICKEKADVQMRDEDGETLNMCWKHMACRLRSRINDGNMKRVVFEILWQ